MPRIVSLGVDFDDDWTRGHNFVSDGVLLAYVTLRIGGRRLLDYSPHGMNASAVSLLRTLERDHVRPKPETDLDSRYPRISWPLFFCAGSLWNRCGIVADFHVRKVEGEAVLSHFMRCTIPATEVLRVPWASWHACVEHLGRLVLRHCPVEKRRVSKRYLPRYTFLRNELTSRMAVAKRRTPSAS